MAQVSPPVQPVYYHNFKDGGLGGDLNAFNGERMSADNVQVVAGPAGMEERDVLKFTVRQENNGEWKGGVVVLEIPRKYGRFEFRVKTEKASHTKPIAQLFDRSQGWPPEIDFMEMGDDFADRQRCNMTVHYGHVAPDGKHPAAHRAVEANMTHWHNVGVEWRQHRISFLLDGQVRRNAWGGNTEVVEGPDIPRGMMPDVPLKLHIALVPTARNDSDPPPTSVSSMWVSWIKVMP